MLLAIDVGNTNLVFALVEDHKVVSQWRAATGAPRTADEYGVWLNQLMTLDGLSADVVDSAVISTVVPSALFDLKRLCKRYFKCDPVVIGEDAEAGMPIRIERPQELGADRLVNAVAAYAQYGGPLIIVDSGTATTFDIVSADGAYEGGIIAAGIRLNLEALHMAAAQLPHIAIERPERVIGKNTVQAMQSGIYWGYVGLIEGLVARIRAEYGAPMKVVATGGLAGLFRGGTDVFELHNDDLTIFGLAEIHRRTLAARG